MEPYIRLSLSLSLSPPTPPSHPPPPTPPHTHHRHHHHRHHHHHVKSRQNHQHIYLKKCSTSTPNPVSRRPGLALVHDLGKKSLGSGWRSARQSALRGICYVQSSRPKQLPGLSSGHDNLQHGITRLYPDPHLQ